MKKIIFTNIACSLLIIIITVITVIIFILSASNRQRETSFIFPRPQTSQTPKRTIGFLPYWQMNNLNNINFSGIDEIIYFGLHFDEKGELNKGDEDLLKQLKKPNISVALVLQNNEKVETFLKNGSAQKKLIESVAGIIADEAYLGINLDFEYSGIPGKETVSSFTSFVENFVRQLKTKHPQLLVSVDVTADAVRKSRLYDVEKLARATDYIILMGYDFYRPASSVAGPVAPLLGKEIYEYDVTTALSDFFKVVPPEKLILGVPYYGWDFPTVDETRGSFVEKRPNESVALSSYKRTRGLLQKEGISYKFDQDSQTPWFVYHDPETAGVRQVWFENEVSLAKKYDLVNKENLAGIAIWALGYDGNYSELSNLLEEKFKK